MRYAGQSVHAWRGHGWAENDRANPAATALPWAFAPVVGSLPPSSVPLSHCPLHSADQRQRVAAVAHVRARAQQHVLTGQRW